jgi:hypothetical protein
MHTERTVVSIATIVMQICFNVTWYVNCLSCSYLKLSKTLIKFYIWERKFFMLDLEQFTNGLSQCFIHSSYTICNIIYYGTFDIQHVSEIFLKTVFRLQTHIILKLVVSIYNSLVYWKRLSITASILGNWVTWCRRKRRHKGRAFYLNLSSSELACKNERWVNKWLKRQN